MVKFDSELFKKEQQLGVFMKHQQKQQLRGQIDK